jgi:hypothetical protein
LWGSGLLYFLGRLARARPSCHSGSRHGWDPLHLSRANCRPGARQRALVALLARRFVRAGRADLQLIQSIEVALIDHSVIVDVEVGCLSLRFLAIIRDRRDAEVPREMLASSPSDYLFAHAHYGRGGEHGEPRPGH